MEIQTYLETNPSITEAVVAYCINGSQVLLGRRKTSSTDLGINNIANGIANDADRICDFLNDNVCIINSAHEQNTIVLDVEKLIIKFSSNLKAEIDNIDPSLVSYWLKSRV